MNPAADLPHPGAALERRFDSILRKQMHGVPLVNPALRVEAVGFRPHGDDWLGVLVTPWFMNLLLLPRKPAAWRPLGLRETRALVFPAGVFQFIGSHDAQIGNFLACSLFSPMAGFATAQSARDTATAALDALFDAGCAAVAEPLPTPATVPAAAVAAPAPAIGKRAFLFGTSAAQRDSHGA